MSNRISLTFDSDLKISMAVTHSRLALSLLLPLEDHHIFRYMMSNSKSKSNSQLTKKRQNVLIVKKKWRTGTR